MNRPAGRLFVLAVTIFAATIYYSCSQTPDVLTPVERTDVYLQPSLLPSNFPGMIYEIWVANATDSVAFGTFGYDQELRRFLDSTGAARQDSNHFVLNDDLLNFDDIFITVEQYPDLSSPGTPGSIFLIDRATLPSDDVLALRFPLNDTLTSRVTAQFNFETPSDSDHTLASGFGLWFSAFYWVRDSIQDTISLDSFRLVWGPQPSIGGDTVTTYVTHLVLNGGADTLGGNSGTVYVTGMTINDALDTIRVFGLDTFDTKLVRFDSVVVVDTDSPFVVQRTAVGQTALFYTSGIFDSFSVFVQDSMHEFNYDNFLQFDYGLPDYSSYGWKYKGWIMSPAVPQSVVGVFTYPAYKVNYNQFDSIFPGVNGGLLTTGTFDRIDQADDGNPYLIGPRTPPLPGEDFLTNLPPGLQSWNGLVPNAFGNSGTIFITLEPTNFVTDTTNFPLIVLRQAIPSIQDTAIADTQTFQFWNMTNTNDGSGRGFPEINVTIDRF